MAQGQALPDGWFLVVGQDTDQFTDFEDLILNVAAGSLATAFALALIGGLATSASMLRRVTAITDAGRDIMRGNLARRIALRGTGDEFDRLSANLNEMLDRIQMLMDGLRQVSNDIAHDLRTPLTRLRQRLETRAHARRRPWPTTRPPSTRRSPRPTRSCDTFGALLRIAQIEAGTRRAAFTDVDLSGVLPDDRRDLRRRRRGPSSRSRRAASPRASTVQGDRQLLTQMIANLVENALRHTPAGTRIEIELAGPPAAPVCTIRDNGPGIPEPERAQGLPPLLSTGSQPRHARQRPRPQPGGGRRRAAPHRRRDRRQPAAVCGLRCDLRRRRQSVHRRATLGTVAHFRREWPGSGERGHEADSSRFDRVGRRRHCWPLDAAAADGVTLNIGGRYKGAAGVMLVGGFQRLLGRRRQRRPRLRLQAGRRGLLPRARPTLDNGLTVGAAVELEGQTSARPDRRRLRLFQRRLRRDPLRRHRRGLAQLCYLVPSASELFGADSPDFNFSNAGIAGYGGTNGTCYGIDDNSTKLVYFSPTFAGFSSPPPSRPTTPRTRATPWTAPARGCATTTARTPRTCRWPRSSPTTSTASL